jgi:DNA-binding transcriptional ArsR family regulator
MATFDPDDFPTHLARDPRDGGWRAVIGSAQAEIYRREGWEVVQIVAAGRIDHPTRMAILDHLAGGHEASAKDLAAALGGTLSTVSYHVRALASAGAIEPTRTEQRHGALARYYRLADSRRSDAVA